MKTFKISLKPEKKVKDKSRHEEVRGRARCKKWNQSEFAALTLKSGWTAVRDARWADAGKAGGRLVRFCWELLAELSWLSHSAWHSSSIVAELWPLTRGWEKIRPEHPGFWLCSLFPSSTCCNILRDLVHILLRKVCKYSSFLLIIHKVMLSWNSPQLSARFPQSLRGRCNHQDCPKFGNQEKNCTHLINKHFWGCTYLLPASWYTSKLVRTTEKGRRAQWPQ